MPTIDKTRIVLPWAKPRPAEPRPPEDFAFLNSTPWRKLSAVYRRAHPVCEVCLHGKCAPVLASSHVDHVIAREAKGAVLDWANLMALCVSHHSTKTRLEKPGHLCAVVDTGGGLVPAPGGKVTVMEKILKL